MESKTYFASSVQAAMDVARRELGPDALLVDTRPAPDAARQFGRLEVTFAWETGGKSGGETAGGMGPRPIDSVRRPGEIVFPAAAPTPRLTNGVARTGGSGLDDIRLEMAALRAAMGHQAGSGQVRTGGEAGSDGLDNTVQTLCETGMERDIARQIASASQGVLRELAARIPLAQFVPVERDERRILAFIGPSGRGKTTSLIKIAMRYGIAARIPTRIYTAGVHGVGAIEQMTRYAAILGVPFQAMESFESLSLALQGDQGKGLVLIDTPGRVYGDRTEMDAMARFLARRPDIERHLVIRAEARSADMQNMLSRFAAIQPSRLLFTGVDEVRGLGAAADTMIRSGIGATFLGTGPRIPEDLEEVNVEKLARSLWMANGLAARAA